MNATKAPLNELDDEAQKKEDALIINRGAPSISLWQFIDYLLPEINGTSLPSFYRLIEEFELVVYDGVLPKRINGLDELNETTPSIVPSARLLKSLRERELHEHEHEQLNDFQFWKTLRQESKYNIWRDDVAAAYKRAGEERFPWLNWYDQKVELDVKEILMIATDTVTGDSTPRGKKPSSKRETRLNTWLRNKWKEWDKPNAKDFAAKLKPFQDQLGSPVKKYHGWNAELVVEWQPGWGATSWGIRAFQNKVDDFKRDDRNAAEK
jgi:hypothetical protein